MTNRSTLTDRSEIFVQRMTDQMTTLARTLCTWVQAEARPLHEIEEQVVYVLHDLGTTLLAALQQQAAPTRPGLMCRVRVGNPPVISACAQPPSPRYWAA